MDKLEDVDVEALQDALDEVESAKAAKRLMVALDYKDGTSVSTLSARYDIPRSTLYYWLDRFENGSIADAIEDEPRPGRPPKLEDHEREALWEALDRNPADLGFDDREWTPTLVKAFIDREFDVDYSEGHVRRLIREGPR